MGVAFLGCAFDDQEGGGGIFEKLRGFGDLGWLVGCRVRNLGLKAAVRFQALATLRAYRHVTLPSFRDCSEISIFCPGDYMHLHS